MAQLIFDKLPESTNRTQTHILNIPNLTSITNITVNTGNVSVVKTEGEQVTIQCTNGRIMRTVQTGGSVYTPSRSVTRYTHYTVPRGSSPPNPPSSIYVSEGGYSGSISLSGLNQSHDWTDGTTMYEYSYSGTIYGAEVDTRTYAYYYEYDVTVIFVDNSMPTLTVTTTNNQNLTENAKFNITGNAVDRDNGNAITVKYSINGGTARNITAQISDGATPIAFSKELTMRNGRLYDGSVEVTGDLAEGVGHILSVWAEDDKGGKTAVQTRTFYAILNRPVVLTINPFETTSKLINNDNVTISGTVSDPDGNQITVLFSVNNSTYTEIYSGLDGDFTFNFPVKLLQAGSNTIKVKAADSYNAETIKTITMKKELNEVQLKRGENRYKVTPPNGQARGLVLWIERDATLNVKAYISMVNDGESEDFQEMIWNRTENAGVAGILEDEFRFQKDEIKTNVSLIVDAVSGVGSIHLISGVLAE